MGDTKKDLLNQRFERLLVCGESPEKQKGCTVWICRCDCGAEVRARSYELIKGDTKSCGCFRRDFPWIGRVTHGKSETSEYRIWESMKKRCHNPNNHAYAHYGGRGITVCERWHKFELFFEDMGCRPGEKYSIDRRDNDGNYCPENCYWATVKEQHRNKRSNVYVVYQGQKVILADACKLAGIPYDRVKRRRREGWSWEEMLATKGFRRHFKDNRNVCTT